MPPLKPATPPPRPATPPGGTPVMRPRVATPPAGTPIARPTTPLPQQQPAGPTREQEFEVALDLLRRKLWAEARQAFLKLAAADTNDKRSRAHMHYARGREAEAAGKPEEARAEWQRALALDPDFVRAKTALADLPPPPPSGGVFSRFFKK
jgi:hypothetical protein